MATGVVLTRTDLTAAELRAGSSQAGSIRAARRMLALALVLEDVDRTTAARSWARKGSRPRAPRDQRYKWAYLFGAACPQRTTSAALGLPSVNTAMMSLHLAEIAKEIAKEIAPGAHAVLVLDGAGYHGTATTRRPRGLVVPDTITLLHLPPSSPELNPMENVWQYPRQNRLANRVFHGYPQILAACCDAWTFFANEPDTVASITTRAWAKVSQ